MWFWRHTGKILHGLYVVSATLILANPGAVPGLVGAGASESYQRRALPECRSTAAPQPEIAALPWAQRWLQPDRSWSMTRGANVTVAVIDSGVDASHPQLARATVELGLDLVTNSAGGNVDCDSHGTAVASIIVARSAAGIGFTGLAPNATILPIRVAEAGPVRDGGDWPVDPGRFAAALRYAADHGAHVINASVVFFTDHPEVADAVRYARESGAVIVAAVGNHHDATGTTSDRTPYPAAYPGVVGVGAIGPSGTRLSTSYVGPHVDLVAPGEGVTAAVRGSGHANWTGTSFAAPFVSATAALLIARNRSMSGDEVVRRMLATADPPAGNADGYGRGVVNPYRALTETVVKDGPGVAPPLASAAEDPFAQAREQRWARLGEIALAVALAGTGLATLAVLAVRIRRRTPRNPAETTGPEEFEDPEGVFFTVPRSAAAAGRAAPARR